MNRSPMVRIGMQAIGAALLTMIGLSSVGAPSASAVPVDTMFPVPVAGIHISAYAHWPAGSAHVVATTDTTMPGLTKFTRTSAYSPAPGCACVVNWRNLTTGAAGTTDLLGNTQAPVTTGSGQLIGAATFHSYLGGIDVTFLPGVGAWVVPQPNPHPNVGPHHCYRDDTGRDGICCRTV